MMKVKLNDTLYDVAEGETLRTFVEKLHIQLQGLAVAIDYEVVPRDKWDEILLKDNMELVMIHAVSGG
ncbi:MAG: sulfur carrier protein ThiS [Proteiniphilum sp.]|jgi:sulfur carrier protein|nr:sulfur carrier protein ThiS [Proteiniphilum sp.]